MKICVAHAFNYPAPPVFEVFADIYAYADYVPRVASVTIIKKYETPSATRFKIRAKIQSKNFQFPVMAFVELIKARGDICVSYKIGPLAVAEALIRIQPVNDASCHVSCDILVQHIPPPLRTLVTEKSDMLVQEYTRIFVDRVTTKLQ